MIKGNAGTFIQAPGRSLKQRLYAIRLRCQVQVIQKGKWPQSRQCAGSSDLAGRQGASVRTRHVWGRWRDLRGWWQAAGGGCANGACSCNCKACQSMPNWQQGASSSAPNPGCQPWRQTAHCMHRRKAGQACPHTGQ